MPTPKPDGDFAVLTDPERAAEFRKCGIDPERIPIRSIIPVRAHLPGLGERLIYELDLTRITSAQRCALVAHSAAKFHLDPVDVERDLDRMGMPILVEDTSAISTQPWKYL